MAESPITARAKDYNAQQQDPKMNDLIAVERIAQWEKLKNC